MLSHSLRGEKRAPRERCPVFSPSTILSDHGTVEVPVDYLAGSQRGFRELSMIISVRSLPQLSS